jgi:hypothetical protein
LHPLRCKTGVVRTRPGEIRSRNRPTRVMGRKQNDPDADHPADDCFPCTLRFLICNRVGLQLSQTGEKNSLPCYIGRVVHWLGRTRLSRPSIPRLYSPPCISLLTMFSFPLALTFRVLVRHRYLPFPFCYGIARPVARLATNPAVPPGSPQSCAGSTRSCSDG